MYTITCRTMSDRIKRKVTELEDFQAGIPNQKWSIRLAGKQRLSWRESWSSYFAVDPTAETIPLPSRMVSIWLAFTCVNRSTLPVVGHFTSI